ncbi:MAG: hypothetical protein R2759_16125 [Bacteroidales bacterium]
MKKNQNKDVLVFNSGNQTILLRNNRDAFYRKQVLEEINSYHQKNPILEEGLETIDFYGKFGFGTNEAGKIYLDHVMSSIYQEGLIKKVANTWALKDHEVKIDPKTQNQLNWLEQTILNVGMDKPMSSEIEEKAHQEKINKDRLKMMLKFLRKEGKLVFFEGEYIHSEIVNRSRKILLEKIVTKADGINEKEFREMIDGTKKLVQMLLGIFLEEGSVIKPTFYILITEKGKNMLN